MPKGPIHGPTLPPSAVRAPHLSGHMLCMTGRPTPRTRDDFPEILLTRQEAATYLGLSKAWARSDERAAGWQEWPPIPHLLPRLGLFIEVQSEHGLLAPFGGEAHLLAGTLRLFGVALLFCEERLDEAIGHMGGAVPYTHRRPSHVHLIDQQATHGPGWLERPASCWVAGK
ncbi:hypothetical protein J2W21_000027 [Sinomonas atrocyanea]|nr:hypothetical protein [Sinomonas atrocyanea]